MAGQMFLFEKQKQQINHRYIWHRSSLSDAQLFVYTQYSLIASLGQNKCLFICKILGRLPDIYVVEIKWNLI